MRTFTIATALCAFLAGTAISGAVLPKHACPIPEDQLAEAVGLYQRESFRYPETVGPARWDHVATIHGWFDDAQMCQDIVDFIYRDPSNAKCAKLSANSEES